MPSGFDRRAAAAAAAAGAVVDEAPLAARLDGSAHQLVRGLEHGSKLVIGDFGQRAPRRDARFPESLRLPEVADSRDEALVEQSIADRKAARDAPQVADHRVQIRRLRKDVRPEPTDGAVVELEHRAVPEHGFSLGAAEDEPGTSEPLRAPGANLPAARHAQVAAKDDPVLEAEQKILPRRLDTEQPAAVEALRELLDGRARMRSLDLHPFADEHLQAPGGAGQGVAFGHSCQATGMDVKPRLRAAAAGAAAATAWGLLEPVDQRVFRCDYSDIALLGKALTRGPRWRAAGFALHALNGAAFGLVFDGLRRRLAVEPRRLALGMALAEHAGLYPLCYFVDRYHPARGEKGLPPLLTNPRAFAQATARHLVFGIALGRLAG